MANMYVLLSSYYNNYCVWQWVIDVVCQQMSNAFDDVNGHQENFQGVRSFDLFSSPVHKLL